MRKTHTNAGKPRRPMWAGIVSLTMAACSTTVVEEPRSADPATDYVAGVVYVMQKERYADTQGWPASSSPLQVVASPLSYGYGEAPRSIAEYRANPGRWPKIRGILPAGTAIRFERLEHRRYPGLDDWFEARGVVANGDFRGEEANLSWISSREPGHRMLRVDPQELQPQIAAALQEQPHNRE